MRDWSDLSRIKASAIAGEPSPGHRHHRIYRRVTHLKYVGMPLLVLSTDACMSTPPGTLDEYLGEFNALSGHERADKLLQTIAAK